MVICILINLKSFIVWWILEVLLFQTGYLTIKSYNEITRTYQLGYPNKEVKDSLLDNLLSAYRNVFPDTSSEETGNLLLAVHSADIKGMSGKRILKS